VLHTSYMMDNKGFGWALLCLISEGIVVLQGQREILLAGCLLVAS
jgi:hypothetical protein